MPRHTHPRARHRHDRGHVRFHRDRVVKKRGEQYRAQQYPNTMGDWEMARLFGAWGFLEDEQAWFGCRKAGCGLCGWPQAEGKRERRRQDRQWRKEWGVG